MNKTFTRKNRSRLPLLAFIFILLSIPLAIYALVNMESFDTRNRASDDLVVNVCTIKFPYVNPESIEQGKVVQVQVDANMPDEKILSVVILDRTGEAVFEKEYEESTLSQISELFTFTSATTGDFSLIGTITTDQNTKPCVIEENRGITVVSTNLAPEFKTLPTSAKPGNVLKVKESYEYLMNVEDAEGDTINYAFSFTPDANWLKYSVIEDGGNGKLTIKFTGVPDKPASYLANIFVHDGYNQHLRSQSWVINVDQDVNDVPKVTIYEPNDQINVKQGEDVKISWEGSDLNQITKYELFISQNPATPNNWIVIDQNLSPKVGNYILNTSKLQPGTYQAIVRATDNFNPPATGMGVSAKIVVGESVPTDGENKPPKPDDGVILIDPQIINISPSKDSKLKNKNATISATLVAGTGSEIEKSTVVFYVDDKDVTKDIKINEISKSEYSVIYSTKDAYKVGTHSVNIRFKDTKGGMAQKDWTFEIVEDDSTKDEDTYNIFGLEIPKRTAMIVGGGLLLLLLAVLVPWILYLLWRGSKDDEYETVYNTTYTPITPSGKEDQDEEIVDVNDDAPEPVNHNTFISSSSKETTYVQPEEKPTTLWTPQVNTEKVEEPTIAPITIEKVEEPIEVPNTIEITNNITPTVEIAEKEVEVPLESPVYENQTPIVIQQGIEEPPIQPIIEEDLVPNNSSDILKLAQDLNQSQEEESETPVKTSQTQS